MSNSVMIPEAAVEAAANTLCNTGHDPCMNLARAALEAALPYLHEWTEPR